MRMIDFLYLGPPKSGSTWLFNLLKANTSIFIPPAKDIYYFDRYYSKGLKWYEGFYSKSTHRQLKGEICHDYIYSIQAMQRIKSYNKDMKFVCILREPVSRAISHYYYSLRVGNNKDGGLYQAVKKNPNIVDAGFLHQKYKAYIDTFSREQFLIIDFQELKDNPQKVIDRLSVFLGVEIVDSMRAAQKVNAARSSRLPSITRFLRFVGLIFRFFGFANFVGIVKNSSLVGVLFKEELLGYPSSDEISWLREMYIEEKKLMRKLFPDELVDW